MWDLPRPVIEPVSPALAGGFITTVPPGKSRYNCLNIISHQFRMQFRKESPVSFLESKLEKRVCNKEGREGHSTWKQRGEEMRTEELEGKQPRPVDFCIKSLKVYIRSWAWLTWHQCCQLNLVISNSGKMHPCLQQKGLSRSSGGFWLLPRDAAGLQGF